MKLFCLRILMLAISGIFSLRAADLEISLSESERLDFGKMVRFEWKTLQDMDSAVYLIFDARIDVKNFTSGGAPALEVKINRIPITLDRLVNKPIQWIHGTRGFNRWSGADDTLTVLYHRWEDEAPQYGRLHRYAFDITSLLEKANGINHITFKSVFSGLPNAVLEIRDIHIQQGGTIAKNAQPPVVEPLYLSEPFQSYRKKAIARHRGTHRVLDTAVDFQNEKISVNAKDVLQAMPIHASFSDKGVLLLDIDGFSTSSQLTVGLVSSGWKRLQETSDWSMEDANQKSITYSNEKIRIERKIIPFAYGISIQDKVTNLTSEDVPVGMLYEIGLGADLEEFRLFGARQPIFYANTTPSRISATTPSLYFRNKKSAFGLLIEDDILRNQASYLAWDETMAFGTDMFYVKGGASHVFTWSIIPTNENGYYDFLNKVRAKWNTYQEIPGLFGFVYPEGIDNNLNTPKKIEAFFEDTGITNPCIPPSTKKMPTAQGGVRMIYGNEPAAIIDPVLENVKSFVKMAHEKVPYLFLLYTDVHLVRNDGDQKILDELSDSVVLDYRGNPVEYRPGWLYNLLPTENTSAGTRFLENLQKYMDVPGVRGVFLDEWDHSRARYSFNHPDDHTVLLDENFKMIRKIGLVPLLIRSYQKKVVDFLLKKQAVLYANQFDSTQSATSLPIVHFAEPTQYDSYLLRGAQLSRTPLSLTVKRSADPWLDTREFLKYGVLTCYYARRLTGDHMLKYIYPITVQKTGPGYVIGENRIVTLRSGRYTFETKQSLQAKIFGTDNGNFLRTVTVSSDDEEITYIDLQLDEKNQEAAVIESVSDAPKEHHEDK